MKIKYFILFFLFFSFKIFSYCPSDYDLKSMVCDPILRYACVEEKEVAPGVSVCVKWDWICWYCECNEGGSCSALCCKEDKCVDRNGNTVAKLQDDGNWNYLPQGSDPGITYDGPDFFGNNSYATCASCPQGNELNCLGLDKKKCGQPCLGMTSCPVMGSCPTCMDSIPIPDCNNTAPSDDVGAPATPENLVLIPETVETNNQFSTLVAHFELRNNSWITDRCEVTLYKGFNPIETKVVSVAPVCAPKTFESRTYDVDFNVNYAINSAGLYYVGVKCYNDTCC